MVMLLLLTSIRSTSLNDNMREKVITEKYKRVLNGDL